MSDPIRLLLVYLSHRFWSRSWPFCILLKKQLLLILFFKNNLSNLKQIRNSLKLDAYNVDAMQAMTLFDEIIIINEAHLIVERGLSYYFYGANTQLSSMLLILELICCCRHRLDWVIKGKILIHMTSRQVQGGLVCNYQSKTKEWFLEKIIKFVNKPPLISLVHKSGKEMIYFKNIVIFMLNDLATGKFL